MLMTAVKRMMSVRLSRSARAQAGTACPSQGLFRAYGISMMVIDTIEIMVSKLYTSGVFDNSNFSRKRPEEYPILSDLYT